MSRESSSPFSPPARPLLIILSGQSGVGKDAVLNGLRRSGLPLEFIVTVTTRQPRPAEKDGVHYHFVTRERFQAMIDGGELLDPVYSEDSKKVWRMVKNAYQKLLKT